MCRILSEASNRINDESRVMKILVVNPATTNPAKEHSAASMAYGIWVVTWSIWLYRAAVDDNMVVSDIGEQWSPNMESAKVAERLIIVR